MQDVRRIGVARSLVKRRKLAAQSDGRKTWRGLSRSLANLAEDGA